MPRQPVSVPDAIPQVAFAASGVPQTTFPFNFPYWEDEDLVVRTRPDSDSPWVVRFDYSVAPTSGVASTGYPSGSIVFSSPVVNQVVLIRREKTFERISQFPVGAPLDLPSVNRDLNRLVGLQQTLRLKLLSTIRSDDPGDALDPSLLTLPDSSSRAGQILSFDQDGRIALVSVSLTNNAVTALWQMSGNGVTTVFAIPGGTSNTAAIYFVTLNGVRQTPAVDYTVADEQITFTTPPGPEIDSILVQVVGSGAEGPVGPAGSSMVVVSPTPPPDPFVGMLWLS